jgi:two-component system NarL family sensor kinase
LDLSNKVEEALWRIGQEALNNCKKHATTKSASIELNIKENQIIMTIRDSGCGFHYIEGEKIPSLGLASMKERAELMGGKITIESLIGKGTTIEVSIPKSR